MSYHRLGAACFHCSRYLKPGEARKVRSNYRNLFRLVCAECHAKRYPQTCGLCEGNGRVWVDYMNHAEREHVCETRFCWRCNGAGEVMFDPATGKNLPYYANTDDAKALCEIQKLTAVSGAAWEAAYWVKTGWRARLMAAIRGLWYELTWPLHCYFYETNNNAK